MCTIKITFRVSAEYCRQQFIKTGACQPETATVEVDPATLSESDRSLILHFAPSAFSGDRVKLELFVKGTTVSALIQTLEAAKADEEARKAKADEETRVYLQKYIAGEGHDTQTLPVYNRGWFYPEAAVNLPEFSELLEAVTNETERRAAVAAAKKETTEKERAAEQAEKERAAATAKKEAEKWIAKHGSAYLKRLFADGYEYTKQGLAEWTASHAPNFSDCEEWAGYESLNGINTPTPEALTALDKVRAEYPRHAARLLWFSGYDSGEVVQVCFNTPFGQIKLECRIENI